jgi:transposase
VLEDRLPVTSGAWLREHPGVKVVCRYRSTAYAAAARDGAPDALQADGRWHIWKNLAEAVNKTVVAHRGCFSESGCGSGRGEGPSARRARARHAAVHAPPPHLLDHDRSGRPRRHPAHPPGARPQALPAAGGRPAHVRAFAGLLTERRGQDLQQWIESVRADDLPALHSFAEGLLTGYDAIVAGLTLPYSNGPAEGIINKVLKRQIYGRVGFALLRKRILLA